MLAVSNYFPMNLHYHIQEGAKPSLSALLLSNNVPVATIIMWDILSHRPIIVVVRANLLEISIPRLAKNNS